MQTTNRPRFISRRDRLTVRQAPRVIIIAAVLMAVIAAAYAITTFVYLDRNIGQQLQESCDNAASAVNDRLTGTTEHLGIIAGMIATSDAEDYQDYIDILSAYKFNYDEMGIITPEGEVWSTNSAPFMLDNPEFLRMVERGRRSQYGVLSVDYKNDRDESVLFSAIDLPPEAKVTGALYGTIPVEELDSLLLGDYAYHDVILILDDDGEIICASSDALNLRHGDPAGMTQALKASVRDNYSSIDWDDYIINTTPLSYNGWSVAILTDTGDIWVGDLHASLLFVIIAIGSLCVIILATVVLLRRQYRGNEQILRRAAMDAVTGMNNANGFISEADELILSNPGQRYALVYICCDSHTSYALEHGLDAGRGLQNDIARIIKTECESGESCAHVGGGDFMLLLRFSNTADVILRVKELNNHMLTVSTQKLHFHYGIYITGEHDDPTEEMISRAAQAARRVMRHGDLVGVFDDELYRRRMREEDLIRSSQSALQNGEFDVLYRPVRDINTGDIICAEAVPFWRRNDGSILYSRDFMPLLTQNALAGPIYMYITERVIRDLSKLNKNGEIAGRVMIRLAPENIMDGTFLPQAQQWMQDGGVQGRQLEVILDEELFNSSPRLAVSTINKLHADGLRVCINCFSAGVSTMYLYGGAQFDTLRLSRTFIDYIFQTQRAPQAVSGIAGIANALGMTAMAEGDLSPGMLDTLRECGITQYENLSFNEGAQSDFCRLDELQPLPPEAEDEDWFGLR